MKLSGATLILLFYLASVQAQAADSSTSCTIIGSSISCDDGTDYTLFNDRLSGPDGEYHTVEKDPFGSSLDKPDSLDGHYTTSDGTKIRVMGNIAYVDYSEDILKERAEKARREEERKKAMRDLLGITNPVTVDKDGFYE